MRKSVFEPYRSQIEEWIRLGLGAGEIATKFETLTGNKTTDRSIRRFINTLPTEETVSPDDWNPDREDDLPDYPFDQEEELEPEENFSAATEEARPPESSGSPREFQREPDSSHDASSNSPLFDDELKALVLKLLRRIDANLSLKDTLEQNLIPEHLPLRETDSPDCRDGRCSDNPFIRYAWDGWHLRWALLLALPLPAFLLGGLVVRYVYYDMMVPLFGFTLLPAAIAWGLAIRRHQSRLAAGLGLAVILVLLCGFGYSVYHYLNIPIKHN